jgi:hypothetical protein
MPIFRAPAGVRCICKADVLFPFPAVNILFPLLLIFIYTIFESLGKHATILQYMRAQISSRPAHPLESADRSKGGQ